MTLGSMIINNSATLWIQVTIACLRGTSHNFSSLKNFMIHITWKNEQAASLSVVVKTSIGISVAAGFRQFLLRNPITEHTERWILKTLCHLP